MFVCFFKWKPHSEVHSRLSCHKRHQSKSLCSCHISDGKPHIKNKKCACYQITTTFLVFQFQNKTLKTNQLICIYWCSFKLREAFAFTNEEISNWERNTRTVQSQQYEYMNTCECTCRAISTIFFPSGSQTILKMMAHIASEKLKPLNNTVLWFWSY